MNVLVKKPKTKNPFTSYRVRRHEEKVYHKFTSVDSYLWKKYFPMKSFNLSVNLQYCESDCESGVTEEIHGNEYCFCSRGERTEQMAQVFAEFLLGFKILFLSVKEQNEPLGTEHGLYWRLL